MLGGESGREGKGGLAASSSKDRLDLLALVLRKRL
jgi:hypothetical protein